MAFGGVGRCCKSARQPLSATMTVDALPANVSALERTQPGFAYSAIDEIIVDRTARFFTQLSLASEASKHRLTHFRNSKCS